MNARAILAACLMLVSGPAFAQPLQRGWVADARTGCRVWSANPQPNAPVAWTGACQNGVTQQSGILQWFRGGNPVATGAGASAGGTMSGYVVATSMPNVDGVATWVNGDRYDGEWRDSLPNGRGMMVLTNGASYSGVWVNGCYRNGNQRAWFGVALSSCP